MSHTPGPWQSRQVLTDSGVTYVVESPSDALFEVCECSSPSEHAEEEVQDNARLIAAAPELLRALQPFVNVANDPELFRTVSRGLRAFEGMSLRAAVDEAARVVKKARGE